MQMLSMAALGAAFIVLETVGTPASAAILNFNFTTQSGATGYFNLDTRPAPEPVLFRSEQGFLFPNAVSDFSFSAPYINLSSVTADWGIAPSTTSDVFGLPANTGVQSGVGYPSGCATPSGYSCTFNVIVLYSGSLSELSVISDDPLSYPRGIGVGVFNPTMMNLLRDDITSFQVQAVPESDSSLGILTFGIGGAGMLLKRKMNSPRNT